MAHHGPQVGRVDFAHVERVWDDNKDLAGSGVSFLLHGLLDHVVDGHFTTVQELDEEIEQFEARLFDSKPEPLAVQKRSVQMRKALVDLPGLPADAGGAQQPDAP